MSQFCGSSAVFINRCCVTSAADSGSTVAASTAAANAVAAMPFDEKAANVPLLDMLSLPISWSGKNLQRHVARGRVSNNRDDSLLAKTFSAQEYRPMFPAVAYRLTAECVVLD